MNEDTTTVALSKLHNPFDFANPVSVKDLFVGRKKEREDIVYYLDHAKSAPRTINLALLGERASGKTSLLNIIEIECVERKLVPVRIDLNESDVESHLAFWFKVFDGIFNRAVTEPCKTGNGNVFNGEMGRTFETYLDLITAFEIPQSKDFCPFLFPVMYAKAMAAGNPNMPVSDNVLKRDLKLLAEEVGRPIVILIDECNLLSSKRALLEMVRNTFMNLPGYMLVFTGTPDLFPLMDEVFSPIIRQFKRIEVSPFASLSDTKDAVLRPLKSVRQDELFTMPNDRMLEDLATKHGFYRFEGDLQDLHTLTGGRPYEIQLVCHFMFRRVQQQQDKRMRLSIDVLEDVLHELRQSHDVDLRPIISAVKKLSVNELNSLDILLRSAGRISVNKLLFAAFITDKTSEMPDDLRNRIPGFLNTGILEQVGDTLRFKGDDFDKIVCKYAARQRDVHLSFDPASPVRTILSCLHFASPENRKRGRRKPSGGASLTPLFYGEETPEETRRELFDRWTQLDGESLATLCSKTESFLEALYENLLEMGGAIVPALQLFRICINGPVCIDQVFYLGSEGETEKILCNVRKHLSDVQRRVAMVGGTMTWDDILLAGCNVSELFQIAIDSESEALKKVCATSHVSLMFDSYVEKRDKDAAVRNALLANQLHHHLTAQQRGHVGYVLLATDRALDSEDVLIETVKESPDDLLSLYNLAIAQLITGKAESAKVNLTIVLERNITAKINNIAVLLFVERSSDGNLRLVERWAKVFDSTSINDDICLNEAANAAMNFCSV